MASWDGFNTSVKTRSTWPGQRVGEDHGMECNTEDCTFTMVSDVSCSRIPAYVPSPLSAFPSSASDLNISFPICSTDHSTSRENRHHRSTCERNQASYPSRIRRGRMWMEDVQIWLYGAVWRICRIGWESSPSRFHQCQWRSRILPVLLTRRRLLCLPPLPLLWSTSYLELPVDVEWGLTDVEWSGVVWCGVSSSQARFWTKQQLAVESTRGRNVYRGIQRLLRKKN